MKNSIRTWIKDLTRNVIKKQSTDNKKAHEKIFNIFSDKGKYKLNSQWDIYQNASLRMNLSEWLKLNKNSENTKFR